MDAILTLHSIDDSGSVLSYSASELETLLDALADENVRVVPLREILESPPASQHRTVLTFDDGIRSVHQTALPILTRRRLPATLYVVSDWVGRTNVWCSQPPGAPTFALMNWDELRDARDAGLTIGCHTASHPRLDRLTEPAWDAELRGSRARLEDALLVPVVDFAYPYGCYQAEAVRRVRAIYASAVTTDMGFVAAAAPHCLPRIDAFYLRPPHAWRPIFSTRTRRYLALRGWLRRLRRFLARHEA